MRRALLTAALAAAATFVCAGLAAAQSRVVNVYNWSDYIDPAVLKEFTAKTGIKVRYDTFDANETLETKLLAGHSGYDVVVPTAYFLQRQIQAGVFRKLDKSKLPNLKNVWPEIAKRLAAYDPGNQYGVNYMWGTTGIGVNVKAMHQRLGANAKIDSWDAVFKPENLAKFKDCGIHHAWIRPSDIMPAALHYLGLDPNSTKQADLERATALLLKIRPQCAQIPFLGIHQCAGERRDLLRGRLVGRHPASQEPRQGGQERGRDRLRHPEGRRADVVRQSGDPEGRAASARGARLHQLPARSAGGGQEQRLRRLRQRQPGEPEIHRQVGARRSRRLSGRGHHGQALYHQRTRPARAAADQPAVDQGEDGAVRSAHITASGGAARAIARGVRGSSPRWCR